MAHLFYFSLATAQPAALGSGQGWSQNLCPRLPQSICMQTYTTRAGGKEVSKASVPWTCFPSIISYIQYFFFPPLSCETLILLLFPSLMGPAIGGLELTWFRKKNWWKDMGFLDTKNPQPPIYKNKQIRAFQGTQGTQHPGTDFQLMASCPVKGNLTQMSLSSIYVQPKWLVYQRFWKAFSPSLKLHAFLVSILVSSSKCLVKSPLPQPPEFVKSFLFIICFGKQVE